MMKFSMNMIPIRMGKIILWTIHFVHELLFAHLLFIKRLDQLGNPILSCEIS